MSGHEELLALIPSYALGALDGDDLTRLETHLETGCEECESSLLDSTRQVEAMAEAIQPAAPSAMVRARLDRALDQRTRSSSGSALRKAAAALLVVGLAWSLFNQVGLRREIDRLLGVHERSQNELAALENELIENRTQLASLLRASRIVATPGAESVVLAGLGGREEARGRTYVDPESRSAVFYATNLDPLADDKTYQLWFIAEDTPVSGGVFEVAADGSATLLVDDTAAVEEIQLWAVTIEPAGGAPQPTGEMALKS